MNEDYAHPNVLVSTDWVDAHRVETESIRIVESDEDVLLYDMAHIPEAVKIDWINDLQDATVRDYIDRERFAELSPYQLEGRTAVRLAERWLTSALRWSKAQSCPVCSSASESRRSIAEDRIPSEKDLFVRVLRRLDRWIDNIPAPGLTT